MRYFETRDPVYPEDSYAVPRTDELADFIYRIEKGSYQTLSDKSDIRFSCASLFFRYGQNPNDAGIR